MTNGPIIVLYNKVAATFVKIDKDRQIRK